MHKSSTRGRLLSRRPYYTVQYNHRGELIYARDKGKKRIYSGAHVFITFPESEFYYGTTRGNVRTPAVIGFNGERVKQFIDKKLLPIPFDPIPIHDADSFFNLILRCIDTIKHGRAFHNHAVLLLEEILLWMHEAKNRQIVKVCRFDAKIANLQNQIRKNPEANWDFKLEAKKLNISYSYLRQIFHKFVHSSPHAYVISCRLNVATQMLSESDNTIYEIAEACGIEQHHFSRLFKQHLGITPLEYRKQYYIQY